jgi:hypothetical protein
MYVKPDEAVSCSECGKLAIVVVGTDWSEIDYDENGELTEEIIHGRKEYALCRDCATFGSDRRVSTLIDPMPWEGQFVEDDDGDSSVAARYGVPLLSRLLMGNRSGVSSPSGVFRSGKMCPRACCRIVCTAYCKVGATICASAYELRCLRRARCRGCSEWVS